MAFLRLLILTLLITGITACSSRARLAKKERPINTSILSQNYKDVEQVSHCGGEPIVRFVDFTFDKKDSLSIIIDITTSLSEQKINGTVSIILDEYELEYANEAESKQYVETLEVETQSRYPRHYRGNISLTNILLSSATPKSRRKESQKQYWNSVSVIIEPEDEDMLLTSSDIFFSVTTTKCELIIYPSYEQIKELKRFLR